MSASTTAVSEHRAVVSVPNGQELVARSQPVAERLFAQVSAQYLAFRRDYYNEEQPSLATPPPAHAEIRQAEVARIADSVLRLVPEAIRVLPLVGSLLNHLGQVANIHSMSEHERTGLHNMTMAFLHGTRQGIQPWYVEWVLESAQNLSRVAPDDYYMVHPWDALLYHDPTALAAFEQAVRTGDVDALQREMTQLADRLVTALRDPIGTQVELAFAGPDAEHRKLVFRLKTAAALALGVLLVVGEARVLLHGRGPRGETPSVVAPLPPQLAEKVTQR